MSSKKVFELIFLVLIFFVALWPRVLLLEKYPPGFHFDEANAGYNIYSILKTGQTVKNGSWPIFLNTFGDYRLMGSVYLMLPTIAILGLNELAVRLPGAIIGAISPLLLYFLVKKISNNIYISALSATFLAFSFWHITFSRASAEGILGIFMSILIFTVYFHLEQKPKLLTGVFLYLLLLLSYISYYSLNLFLIIFIPAVTFVLWLLDKKFKKGFLVILISVYSLYLVFPQAAGFFFSHATARYNQVNFKAELNERLKKQISEIDSTTPIFVTRMFHNKVINTVFIAGNYYTEFFSPNFLLFHGGPPVRYRIPNVGLINVVEFLGLILLLITNLKKRIVLFFLGWILIAPIAASLTSDEQPNVHRAILMLPAIAVLASCGIVSLFERLRKVSLFKVYMLGGFLGLLFIYHFLYFLNNYYLHQKYYEANDRNFASRDIAKYLATLGKDKEVLATTNTFDTDTYVLFFQKIDPKIAQAAYNNNDGKDIHVLNYTFTGKSNCASLLDAGKDQYNVYVDNYYCDIPTWNTKVFYQADGRTPAAKVSER